jgi:hypothetical protein
MKIGSIPHGSLSWFAVDIIHRFNTSSSSVTVTVLVTIGVGRRIQKCKRNSSLGAASKFGRRPRCAISKASQLAKAEEFYKQGM